MGVTIGADPEIEPRTQLVTVPYAYRISTVDGATGGAISGRINKSKFGAGAVSNQGVRVVADLTGQEVEHGQVHFGNTTDNQWVDMWFIYSMGYLMGNYIVYDGSNTTHGHFRMSLSGAIVYSGPTIGTSAASAYWDADNYHVRVDERNASDNRVVYWYRDWSFGE